MHVLENIWNMKQISTFQVTDWLKGQQVVDLRSVIGYLGHELAILWFTKVFVFAYVYFALIRVTETSHKNGIQDIMWKSASSRPRWPISDLISANLR